MARKFKIEDFNKALAIAQADVKIDPVMHPIDPMFGCGCSDFEPIEITLEQMARHIRWQAAFMDGTWDYDEINSCKVIAKRVFLLED